MAVVDVHVLEKWTELLSIPREKPARPTWLDGILSLTFKLELPEGEEARGQEDSDPDELMPSSRN